MTLERIGREILGPAFSLHLERAVQILDQRQIDRVCFSGAEPLLRQLYQRVRPLHQRPAPAETCLAISRGTTTLAAMGRFGARELEPNLDAPMREPLGLRQVLDELGLFDEETGAAARRAGLGDARAPIDEPWDHAALHAFLDDRGFQERAAARAADARASLLRQLGRERLLDGDRVALVGVGFSGRLIGELRRATEGVPGAPEWHGIHLGFFPTRGDRNEKTEHQEGTLFDYRRLATAGELAGLELPELFHQAVLEASPNGDGSALRALQRGILACTEERVAAARGPSLLEERGEAQSLLERLLFLPRAEELAALDSLLRASQSPWRRRWTPGRLARLGGPVACRAFHVYARLRVWRRSRAALRGFSPAR